MYAYTLLHGPRFRRDCVNFVLLLQRKLNASLPPKAKIQVIASLDILFFFPLDSFTVNRDFWFLPILYMLTRKS